MVLYSTVGSAKNILAVQNHLSLYRDLELSYMVLWRLKKFLMFHYRCFRAVYWFFKVKYHSLID